MSINIKAKEATAIINSLVGGVVPKLGIQHITVGRKKEIDALLNALDEVSKGHSMVKFWIGDFGSGKSFMLHLVNTVALKQKFVVSNADFTPERRLYANDRKAVAIYTEIINNIAIATKPNGGALPILLEKWIEKVIMETASQYQFSFSEITIPENKVRIENAIQKIVNEISDTGGFTFGVVLLRYLEGYLSDDTLMRKNALRWLTGEYTTKTEARQDLGVREIINDQNYYGMLKVFCQFFTFIGYKGFLINLDEAINLYKIAQRTVRDKNYEKILSIYNDCFQGNTSHLFFNFAGTKEFLEDERKGLFSYNALKTRLEGNKFESAGIRDFSQPVIKLVPLKHEEIFVLLQKLKNIFEVNYQCEISLSDKEIELFMENLLNQPGASEFLMPREVIRDFLNLLNIFRQNPNMDRSEIFNSTKKEERGTIDFSELNSIEEI